MVAAALTGWPLLPAAGYLTLSTLLAAAVGSLVRQTGPAASVLLGVYFVAAPVLRGRSATLGALLPDTGAWDGSLVAPAVWAGAMIAAATVAAYRDS
ncbi:hypothetical protein [Actinoplanes sp. N902-109]|uniref:hypothetical protein n=1 Tax=Actinoplanes sp. (strain N902-109) TaxID=649831 RepID=UPI0003A250B8|nr:hypothetical protein [Actinoplanes sp. N902-109]